MAPIKDQLLTLLSNGIVATNGTHGGNIAVSDINTATGTVLDDLLANQPYNSNQPKAFLNWMIVDEEFNKVTSSFHMGSVQVQPITGSMQKVPLTGPANMTVRRGGWLYVYVSNESNQDVYFDDLVINHKRGPVVETNSYYAFGMEIPGLTAKAIGFGGNVSNRIKYNGKELQNKEFADGSGLEWEDYGARMYDPQIGMWHNMDPLADINRRWSPYNYALDNPIRFIDPDGMWSYDANGNASTSDQTEIRAFLQQSSGSQNNDNKGDSDGGEKKKKAANNDNQTNKTDGEIKQEPENIQNDPPAGNGKQSLPEMKENPPNVPGYKPPKSGPQWIRNPNGKGMGWLDKKGNVWVPDDHNGTHATHWDVQDEKGGGYTPVYPAVSTAVKVDTGVIVGVALYEIGKWGLAIFLAPETLGGSLVVAGATP